VDKPRNTEEQLKADIFTAFSRYLKESSSDRRQVYFVQLSEAIIRWCTDYLNIKATEMGLEIFNTIQRLVKQNNTNVLKDESGFFGYLKTSLTMAETEYYRNLEKISTGISRDSLRKMKMVENIITMIEGNLARNLTENERRHHISEWFGMEEYSRLLNLENIGSLEFTSNNLNDNSHIDFLNSKTSLHNMGSPYIDPQDEIFAKLDMAVIRDALEHVLSNTQDKTRECYRSLFTSYCINKSIDFEGLTPLLDGEILAAHQKDGKKPMQHEAYLKYHLESEKASAGAIASKMTKEFLGKLNSVLKEKKF